MTTPLLVQGAGPPYDVTYVVTSAAFDLTTVTAAEFRVLHANGQISIWPASLGAASATSLTLVHTLAAAGADVPTAETVIVQPQLTLQSGVLYCEARRVSVVPKFTAPFT